MNEEFLMIWDCHVSFLGGVQYVRSQKKNSFVFVFLFFVFLKISRDFQVKKKKKAKKKFQQQFCCLDMGWTQLKYKLIIIYHDLT